MLKKSSSWVAASLLAATALYSSLSLSQAVVRDSQPLGDDSPRSASVSPQSAIYDQLQSLRQEVTLLRGLVEEQAYLIKKLQQQRIDDYDEFDRRISELRGGGAVSPSQASEEEQVLYQSAIDKVLQDKDYGGALKIFDQYLTEFPKGALAPDVYFWQGEIYLLQDKVADAELAFSSLTSLYPSHDKNYDALYKLAEIYVGQGKKADAKPLLESVVASASNPDLVEQAKALLKKVSK